MLVGSLLIALCWGTKGEICFWNTSLPPPWEALNSSHKSYTVPRRTAQNHSSGLFLLFQGIQAHWYLYLLIFICSWTCCYPSYCLTQSRQDWAVITAGGESFHIPVLLVSPSMKWESWFKHTEYFSSKWLLKEKLAFQSYDVFFGKCTGPTIIKLDKIKGKVEKIPPQIENCRILQLEDGKGNCNAVLENVSEITLQEKK